MDQPRLSLVSTERSGSLDPIGGHDNVAGVRDIALFSVLRNFQSADDTKKQRYLNTEGAEAVTVEIDGTPWTNQMRWLTHYADDANPEHHAERPKLVALGPDRFVVLWERWTTSEFVATYGMVLDADGNVVVEETRVSSSHLQRGDDSIAWGDKVLWVTSDKASGQL